MTLLNQFCYKYQEEIWEIIQSTQNYFDDTLNIKTFHDFQKWWKGEMIDYVFGMNRNGTIFGFGYLTSIENDNGCINLVMRRKAIPFRDALDIFRKYMNFFIDKYNLKMLYAVVRKDNLACLQLLKMLRFKITTILKDHEVVNGKPVDCILATYMREFK